MAELTDGPMACWICSRESELLLLAPAAASRDSIVLVASSSAGMVSRLRALLAVGVEVGGDDLEHAVELVESQG